MSGELADGNVTDSNNPAPEGSAPPEAVETVAERAASIIRAEFKGYRFSGPLPHPRILEEYERIVPGAAERIIAMAEKEQTQRHSLESRTAIVESRLGTWGLVFAFVLAMVLLTGAIWLISRGYSLEGGLLAGVDLITLSAIFIYGRATRDRVEVQLIEEPQQQEG